MGVGVVGEPRIRSLSFLTPGNFPDEDPYAGLEDTLGLFEFGERAGFDGAWIRQRPRLQPYARGLVSRLWYGAASLNSGAVGGPDGAEPVDRQHRVW